MGICRCRTSPDQFHAGVAQAIKAAVTDTFTRIMKHNSAVAPAKCAQHSTSINNVTIDVARNITYDMIIAEFYNLTKFLWPRPYSLDWMFGIYIYYLYAVVDKHCCLEQNDHKIQNFMSPKKSWATFTHHVEKHYRHIPHGSRGPNLMSLQSLSHWVECYYTFVFMCKALPLAETNMCFEYLSNNING